MTGPRFCSRVRIEAGTGGAPERAVSAHAMRTLFAAVHAVRTRCELAVALGFPDAREGDGKRRPTLGDRMDLWSHEREALVMLRGELELPRGVREHLDHGAPRAVDDDAGVEHRAYVRYRVPTKRSSFVDARAARYERCARLPFVNVRSRSNGHEFKLFVLPMEVDGAGQEGTIDTYGLSRLAAPIGLPRLD